MEKKELRLHEAIEELRYLREKSYERAIELKKEYKDIAIDDPLFAITHRKMAEAVARWEAFNLSINAIERALEE